MEGDHASEAVGEHFSGKLMLGMTFQPRIENVYHFRPGLQVFGNSQGVLRLGLKPQMQRMHAPEGQPGVEGTDVSAQIVIIITNRIHQLFGTGNCTAQGVAVAYNVLSAGMENHIGAVLQGS
ncbi:hypothetical protein SDC9_161819 [bioreactor metagenome]|uniref:Uncharacterized protein n=1 Tax=bioreactor metagenome TaxID=1076179 RepID=A0A645FLR1_9ZZZZ